MVFLIFMGQLLCLWGMEVGLFRFLMELIASHLFLTVRKWRNYSMIYGGVPTKMW